MAGGATTPRLVSAVSNAGALGFIGAAYLSPDQIQQAGRDVREHTDQPFGINLFAPVASAPVPNDIRAAIDALATYHEELGLPAPTLPTRASYSFDEQLAAAVECGATVFSFTFGLLPAGVLERIRSHGMMVIGTATTVDEAIALEDIGVDAVAVQGSEAGAHRGTFGAGAGFDAAMVGTMALVPQCADALSIPVIASGGIMDGRGISAALALGASAVQMGTAFLTTDESGIPVGYKEAILSARETDTKVTRAFSGRAARGLVNRFMREVEARGPTVNLGYPMQNSLTRPLRTEAAKRNLPDYLSLWMGQGVRLARREPAAELVRRLVAELDESIQRLNARQLHGFR